MIFNFNLGLGKEEMGGIVEQFDLGNMKLWI